MARLAPTYLPREPHATVLYRLVKEHGAEFLRHARESCDGPLPRYVEAARTAAIVVVGATLAIAGREYEGAAKTSTFGGVARPSATAFSVLDVHLEPSMHARGPSR